MGSVLSWTANSVLFVIGCWLAADTANEVIAAALLPSAPAAARRAAHRPRPAARAQLGRARDHPDPQSVPLEPRCPRPHRPTSSRQELEKSRLPVTLLGTFASSDPNLSRATLMDKEKNETLVVGIGDQIKNAAEVMRIERRRVVIIENGAPRELTFGDERGRGAA